VVLNRSLSNNLSFFLFPGEIPISSFLEGLYDKSRDETFFFLGSVSSGSWVLFIFSPSLSLSFPFFFCVS